MLSTNIQGSMENYILSENCVWYTEGILLSFEKGKNYIFYTCEILLLSYHTLFA